MKLLKTLSETPGAPGREERVRELIQSHLQNVADEMEVDNMGNLFAWKRATSPGDNTQRVMLACHMDEIAFYVRHVSDDGYIRLQQLGGFDPRNLHARRVLIQTRQGEIVGNMNPGTKPIHVQTPEDRKRPTRITDLFVDTGLSPDEVKAKVKVGDPVTLMADFVEMGEHASGKCMDNRVACWIGIRVLEALARLEERHHDVCVCFTVQEEIGIRGAQVAAKRVDPHVGIGIDVTLAVDIPGSSPEDRITALGEGVAIKIMDSSMVSDRGLVDEFIDTAEKNEIPYQLEILPFGGTDGAALQRGGSGSRALTISVPCRYVHTVTETVHKKDLQGAVDLIVAYLQQ